jgi:hypothetical protein
MGDTKVPYIDRESREIIDDRLETLIEQMQQSGCVKGDVNYAVCRLVLGVLKPTGGWRYTSLSNAISVLRDAECELRRRLLDPYEDGAIAKNGDVPEINQESFRS